MRAVRLLTGVAGMAALWLGSGAAGNSVYEQHVVFDNTRGVGWYVHSAGEAVAPSRIELVGGKLPLETRVTHSPPNALRLSWTSAQGGDWRATIAMPDGWGTHPDFRGDALTFWVYADGEIDAGSSPRIRLDDSKGVGNPTINLIGSLPKIPARTWIRVVLPFADFKATVRDTSDEKFDPRLFDRITIVQGLDDGRPHAIVIDDIRIEDRAKADTSAPVAPAALTARGYERHVDLAWQETRRRTRKAIASIARSTGSRSSGSPASASAGTGSRTSSVRSA